MDSSVVWNGQDPTLSVSSQDDFQQFLDMGMNGLNDSLQFDFQDFSNQQGQSSQLMQQEDADSGHDTAMQDQMAAMTTASSHPTILGGTLGHDPSPSESLSDIDAQIQYLQHQRHQQQQRQIQEQQRNFYTQNRLIPPTPNSIEMHPNAAQYYSQSDSQQQAMFEGYRQAKEQEMAFTPLVSPAVTPLDPHFNIPEYTVPGAYFSPLSSPALHAQNEHSSIYEQRTPGANNSPIDVNQEPYSMLGSGSSMMPPRKSSKKASVKSRSTRAPRQSPIVKPRRGKKTSSTTLPPQTLEDIIEPSNTQGTDSSKTASSHSTGSTGESENGSISPEHLSDMAPPPIPHLGSAGRSPYVLAQKAGTRTQSLVLGSPATPASLMRLTQSPQVGQPATNMDMDVDEPGMDGFALPEAANIIKSQTPRLDTQNDDQSTPTMTISGAITPRFQSLPSPTFMRPKTSASASQSPQIDAMNGANGGTARKTPLIAARGSKKRASSSVLASPALLPRISPSIKPLLPGQGKVSEDTASLLLASKSNYQNILEGTNLPGVSYPSELSTNLTSKRTSHKIAEQGRRNRINSALQEIATLLPRGQGKDSSGEKSGGSGDAGENESANGVKGTPAAQSANSKASTVEQAIEYIKQLKKDLADVTKRAEEAEKQLKATS